MQLFKSDEMEELGYLKQAKGNKANKVVRSQTFWKNVDTAVIEMYFVRIIPAVSSR